MVSAHVAATDAMPRAWPEASQFDLRFSVGLTARNAQTLLRRPHRLFDLEACHPAERALVLGEPLVTPGLLAAPLHLVARDPVLTFNLLMLLLPVVSAWAMYLVVREWTGLPAAAIAAGLLFGFHSLKLGDVTHYYVWDNAWTLLLLLFAQRVAAGGSWRDGIALGLAGALQMGESFYPLLAAILLALPVAGWLIVAHGVRWIRRGPTLTAVAIALLAALAIFHPYLLAREEGLIGAPEATQRYIAFAWLRPGQVFFPGWLLLAGAAAALGLGRSRTVPALGGRDPRWAVLAGGALCLVFSTGGTTGDVLNYLATGGDPPPVLPNPWDLLMGIVPGLEVVRAPAALLSGAHLALCLLAGVGLAGLLRIVPERARGRAGALLAAAVFAMLLPPARLDGQARLQRAPVRIRPDEAQLEFFAALAKAGNAGPILELPMQLSDLSRRSGSVLLVAYHHRRTSACYNSFVPAGVEAAWQLGGQLPDPEAVQALRKLGFTTVVVHHPREAPFGLLLRKRLDAATDEDALARVLATPALSAFAVLPGSATPPGAAPPPP